MRLRDASSGIHLLSVGMWLKEIFMVQYRSGGDMVRLWIPRLIVILAFLAMPVGVFADENAETQRIESIENQVEQQEYILEEQDEALDREVSGEKDLPKTDNEIFLEKPEPQAPHDFDDSKFEEK